MLHRYGSAFMAAGLGLLLPILNPVEVAENALIIDGKEVKAFKETDPENRKPAFILKAPYENFARIVNGQLDAMQALMTRKLGVQGNMAVLMRSVPTVLDFVRCAREVTTSTL